MKVCVENLLWPANFLALITGFCPYRRFSDHSYGRSTLGTILQIANIMLLVSVAVYVMGFYVPAEYYPLKNGSLLIMQSINLFIALWFSVDRFIFSSTTLRCFRVSEDLVKAIRQISSLKQPPIAFYLTMLWTIEYLPGVLRLRESDFLRVTTFVTQLLALYCETLVIEFVTVICVALKTINQTLENWQTCGNCDVTALNELQSLYLKAAHLAEVVNNFFGISWLVSFIAKSIQIVLLRHWILDLLSAAIDSSTDQVSSIDRMDYAYLIFRLVFATLRSFQICYYFDLPSVKRVKMVSMLCDLITRNGDSEISNKMNEFTLQVALRKMKFTAGGFFDINLHFFVETMGTWFTLFVILIHAAEA